MSEEEEPTQIEELEQLTEEELEEIPECECPPSFAPKPRKTDITLLCERSLTYFPLGATPTRGWIYICDFACPKEYVVRSSYADTTYCASAEDFYNDVMTVLYRGRPVTFDRDYFAVSLPTGKKGNVRACIIDGVHCEADYWTLVVRPTPRAIILFSTDRLQVEEFFGIQIRSPFIRARGVDMVSHTIVESVKDIESMTKDVLPMLDLTGQGPGAVSKAMKTYAAFVEAVAQIISGCMSFGSDFIRRNMRFMTCGNFVPIPYLIAIIRNMKQCEKAQSWECMSEWILELDNLIDAYRRPGPPYELPKREKNIFGGSTQTS